MKGLLTASVLALALTSYGQSRPLNDSERKEVADLRAKAGRLTKQVSEITSHSNLQDSDEGIKLLKQVVDELAAIRERLKALEDSRDAGTKQTQSLSKDVDALKNTHFTGFEQFQYFTTNKVGSAQPNGFLVRRARFGLVQKIDARASLRFAIEFVEGTSRMDTRLKDAVLDYNLAPNLKVPSWISFGQQVIPIGFDLERSDADREFPERATYNRTLFTNERSRGVILRANVANHIEAGVGAMDSLSIDDPEQSGLAPAQGSKVAGVGFVRVVGPDYRVGVSEFAGQRPSYTAGAATSPELSRSFTYFDGELRPRQIPKLFLRGEAMLGHDRLPSATANPAKVATHMSGFQAQAGYDLDSKNQLNLRWEQFDPDLNSSGNAINGYALSYQFFFSPYAKLQLAHEVFTDESRTLLGQRRYYQTTFRIQFRF